jgi:hypothetical protein
MVRLVVDQAVALWFCLFCIGFQKMSKDTKMPEVHRFKFSQFRNVVPGVDDGFYYSSKTGMTKFTSYS